MKTAELKAYEIFKTRFGEKEAETLFDFFESNKAESVTQKQVDDRLKDFKEIFATKEDLVNTRAEIIKWMFIFWASQLAATFAFLKFFM